MALVARTLLIAFWKYLEKGEVPEGAEVVELEAKVRSGRRIRRVESLEKKAGDKAGG